MFITHTNADQIVIEEWKFNCYQIILREYSSYSIHWIDNPKSKSFIIMGKSDNKNFSNIYIFITHN